ncbi:cytochrome C [Lentibacillus cibarius]|uniref:Cytochrome C n=1 Tax=Lentibacillus cibarius TaxID=2583219 RepID=A0A549YEV5_9BACI|nr:cytochrome C [Lentibacillus cibarius]TMN21515.1 cytochrome C [Lentibacillus cibarius]TRM10414.1 cytochrome C [Lentibacillus cibarius]
MKVNSIIFIAGFIVAFAAGYLFFGGNSTADQGGQDTGNQEEKANDTDSSDGQGATDDQASEGEEETSVPAEAEPLSRNNCLSCHAVESLGAEGGTTGPDLSNAYNVVEDKHGKPLEEFLKEPTSAVMSTVISDNPLEDEEREAIIEALKKAAE